MLTAHTLFGVEVGRLGGLSLQARILFRSGLVAECEIESILSEGKLSRADDVSQAYDVILGRW
jgi:hypothetical protein